MKNTLPLLALLASCASPPRTPWPPAAGPLLSRFAKDVSPENVHPEYPRPQMVRDEWLNLNGLWNSDHGKILVPFPVESALSGVMKRTDRITYRRSFDCPWMRALLHFEAVNWEATVALDGRPLGTHRGGYDRFSFDIGRGHHDLVVEVFNPADAGDQARGKQVNKPEGIYYTPSTGIWQSVWLEPVPDKHITELVVTPDVDAKCARVRVETSAPVDIVANGVRGRSGEELAIPVPNPRLWSPDDPHLYDLHVRAGDDEVTSYFGMRKIEVKDGRMLLNGAFVFQLGTLDQGFWPDGLYAAPTDEALRYDIEITKKLGFNMIRKHVKVEPARWYYWADKLGVLVWQDMPSGHNATHEGAKQFEVELRRMIVQHRHHPSIIMWVVFNEGWGQYDTERLVPWVKKLDPSRLVSNASGWTDKNVGDILDIHAYPDPLSPRPEATRAAVLGEFGGISLAVEGHMWTGKHWGYQGAANSELLTRRLVGMFRRVWELKDRGLNAAVYTQITDVETEANGLLTYDRAVIKVDVERFRAALEGRFPTQTVVAPTLQKWRYTFDRPVDGWMKSGFDDSAWKEGSAGFGTEGTPGTTVKTVWNTSDIWLRREVEIPGGNVLLIHHDEDVEVYVDGALAASATGYTTSYGELPLKTPIKPGRRHIAVHCRQTGGGQYIDLGIIVE